MSGADWNVGDLAICIRPGRWVDPIEPHDGSGPKTGSIHEVEEVGAHQGFVFLGFSLWPEEFYEASAFRKIAPLSDLERLRAETEFHVSKNLARHRARQAAQ